MFTVARILQGQGLDRSIRIQHMRGGDEPLLWTPDTALGAINSAHRGDTTYVEALGSTILLEMRTPDSLDPDGWADERPWIQPSGWSSKAFFPVRRNGGMVRHSQHSLITQGAKVVITPRIMTYPAHT